MVPFDWYENMKGSKMNSIKGMKAGSRKGCFGLAVTLACTTLLLNGACNAINAPFAVVDSVDLERYAGKWYEIARYPNAFELDCVGVTAEYSIRDDGRVDVLNTCYEGSLDGRARTIAGTARSTDASNARLKVTFFWPFEGDYWIMDLDEDYTYAVVGDPGRNFLWILSRTPELDAETLEGIYDRLPDQGFDPDRLILVEQATDDSGN